MPLPMAREEKRVVELKPVDDESARGPEVVRLVTPEMEPRPLDEQPLRLGKTVAPVQPASRLDVPKREDYEIRTHQPGIEALIESDLNTTDLPEHGWGEAAVTRKPIPWGWFFLIALAIIGGLVWSLGNLRESTEQAETIRTETLSALERDQTEEVQALDLVNRIEQAIKVYFSAASVDSLLRLVRHPERVEPLMRRYYAQQPVSGGSLRSVRMLQPLTLENRGNFWMASVMLTDGKLRNLVIEIDPHGEPRIDWETLVCYQPMPWDDFVRERPAGSSYDFRVYVEPDNFYSHEFADAGQWLCFRLTALDAEETLFGYIRRDHAEAAKIQQLIDLNSGRRTSLILRLLIPDSLQSRRGVVIEKMVSPRWLFMDPPETDS
jgi:hypothetical protein